MRKVEQVPSVSFEGEEKIATPNPEVYVYDTSGPVSYTHLDVYKRQSQRLRKRTALPTSEDHPDSCKLQSLL